MDHPCSEKPEPLPWNQTTARSLRLVAWLVPIMLVVVGSFRLVHQAFSGEPLQIAHFEEFVIFLAGGMAAGGLLLGLSEAARFLRDLRESLIRLEQFQYERRGGSRPAETEHPTQIVSLAAAAVSDPPATEGSGGEGRMSDVLRLLEDIRDNSLLSDEERREKRLRVAEEDLSEAEAAVRSLVSRGEFVQGQQIAERMVHKYPTDERTARLVKDVDQARERREGDDVSSVVRQVEDLISISAWQRAGELAQQLKDRYPDSVEARQLLLRIERDHRLFMDEQRRRMYAEIQRFVTRRRWEEACTAARAFIERFPGSEEAAALLAQMATLETNSEIDIRQKLEVRIMDYAKHGRYIEAVELARKMIEKFPDSPQAEALRLQLPRLEELANDPNAPPARVRVED